MQGLSEINKKFAKEMGVDIEIQQDFNFSKIGEFLIVKNQSYLAIWDVSKQVWAVFNFLIRWEAQLALEGCWITHNGPEVAREVEEAEENA